MTTPSAARPTAGVAVVIGAGQGLGRAICFRLARDGFQVSPVAAFQGSPQPSYVSGQVSYVDGGLSAGRPGG